MKQAALQTALYTALSGVTEAEAVHIPKAPQAADGALDTPFPYLAVPNVVSTPFDTATSLGVNAVVQVDGYSRSASDLEIKALSDGAYAALHRQALTIAGAVWVTTEHEDTDFGWEDDGKTRRFISRYRVTYDEI